MTEDGTVGWHHRLNGHESEQTQGDGEGQGSPACCSPWGHKESDVTQRLKIVYDEVELQDSQLMVENCLVVLESTHTWELIAEPESSIETKF